MKTSPVSRRTVAALAVAGCGALAFAQFSPSAMSEPASVQTIANDGVRAPEFPANFTWFNTDKPLSLRGLKGKLVLLDFWTYGCINCMHILPDLHKLEQKYNKELVIIGVHSAKFVNESDAQNIRNAMLRYNIEHPILVDQKSKVWSDYAVRAWPTLVLIDPAGKVVGQVAGEGHYDILDRTIAKVAADFRKKGELDETPLKFALDKAKTEQTPLAYPGKVLARNGQIFVADSNHNRIVVSDENGKVSATIGTGEAALRDGDFQNAAFSNPQGMALDGEVLYVADTNNHAIRAIDLKQKTVRTIAGTGKQAAYRATGGMGTGAALSSPWDVLFHDGVLYLAMAGSHQIWNLDLKSKKVAVFAGSGAESRRDGTLKDATFAQPSGLATNGETLFVADSESSSIRAIDLPGNGEKVTTLAGGDLFDFGDKDGTGLNARFQHPLGLAYQNGALYIADTYNSKIKKLDPKTGEVSTVFGEKGALYEPGGLSFDGDSLLIADTNNQLIRRLDLDEKSVSALKLAGLEAPAIQLAETSEKPDVSQTAKTRVLAPGTKGTLILNVQLPKGFHLNLEAPQKLNLNTEGEGLKLGKTLVKGKDFSIPLRVPFETGKGGSGVVNLGATISYCNDGKNAVCKVASVRLKAPFEIKAGGAKTLEFATEVE